MRLEEVTLSQARTLRRTPWEHGYSVGSWLSHNGFYRTGPGSFGTVYANNESNLVVKVVHRQDTCYLAFVEWIKQQPPNPHLPRCGKIIRVPGTDGYFLLMEKLTRLEKGDFRDHHWAMVCWLYYNTHKDYYARRFGMRDYEEGEQLAEVWERDNPLLAATIRKIRAEVMSDSCPWDLHVDNLMMRGNTMVIIDPVQMRMD